tara:strand:- start:1711 stop:2682 length:972 start_codon:yes stop_codon:yes gene_type:complete
MKFKVLLAIFTLFSTAVMATGGKYTLTYRAENKWIATQDIKDLRKAIVFFQNNDLRIKAICSSKDKHCKKRVDIINHIFHKQKVKQQVSIIENSSYIPKNILVLETVDLDKNKYSNLFINYKNKEALPVKKSQADVKNIIKYAELKYLSKFKMYCKKVDQLCKNRFKVLNSQLSKQLKFKYNFALYENNNLDNNQVQLIAHRHDYNIHNPETKPVITAKKEVKKKPVIKKKGNLIYSKEKNLIVFKDDSSELLILEKVKVENLIANSKNNKFKFACGNIPHELCQERARSIKDYALKNTSNIIIMEQFHYDIFKDYVLVIDNK